MSSKHDQSPTERPIYPHETIVHALEARLTVDQKHSAARTAFGELAIGGNPLYVGKRSGDKPLFSCGFKEDGTPAIFVGHAEQTAEEALTSTMRVMLTMFRRGQLGLGLDSPMAAKPSEEFKERRALLKEALFLVAVDRLEGVDPESSHYAEHLGDFFENFVGEPVSVQDQEDITTRTMDYIEYCVEQANSEQSQV